LSNPKELKEIPRAQLKAVKPTLDRIFARSKEEGIAQAYREHGYRLHEIAKHLGVHYATVSRRLKQLENSSDGSRIARPGPGNWFKKSPILGQAGSTS
jgi:putative transposase